MKIEVKVLYDSNYKDADKFDEALTRWENKGWHLADMVNSLRDNANAAIIYRVSYE